MKALYGPRISAPEASHIEACSAFRTMMAANGYTPREIAEIQSRIERRSRGDQRRLELLFLTLPGEKVLASKGKEQPEESK